MDITQIKVILLGDPNVGKSSILYRLITGNYKENIDPTIGACYMGKIINVNDSRVKLNIWDTAGQEIYNSFAKMYCRNAQAVIFVFDSSKIDSFQALEKWNQLLCETNTYENTKLYIAANKSDLYKFKEFPEEIRDFASKINAEIFEISAKKNTGIEDLFNHIAKELVSINDKKKTTIILKNSRLFKKKQCCKR